MTEITARREDARLTAVRRYDILDTPPDGAFDRITAIAARIFDVPISIISVVDHDRIWFKSHHGLDVQQIDREAGLCASAILQDGPWILTDASVDIRALANPLVAGAFGLRFYVGIPLRTCDGHNLGTLCVIDRKAKTVSEEQIGVLEQLAGVVIDQLELRFSAHRALRDQAEAMDALRLMSKEIDHRVMNSLQIVASLLSLQSREVGKGFAGDQLKLAANRVLTVAQVHRHFFIDREVLSTPFLEFLHRLSVDLRQILAFAEITVDGTESEIGTPCVVPLALIVTELVTNAVKYGATRIEINFRRIDTGEFELAVRDNGPGLKATGDSKPGALGMKVIHALSQQLKAGLSVADGIGGSGAGFLLHFR